MIFCCLLLLFFLYKRRWGICGLLLCFVVIINTYTECFAFGCISKDAKSDIKVMCFNVHLLNDSSEARACCISNIIVEEDPDFVFMTEYYGSSSDTLLNAMLARYPYHETSNRWDNNCGDVFFSRWSIDTTENIKPRLSYGSMYRVQLSHEKDTLAIYCCHLSSNLLDFSPNKWDALQKGYEERAKEADILYDALTHEKYPAIVMGDMNDISGSYTLGRIESAGLTDAWWKGGFGYGTTYHDHGLRLRLDHILYDEERLTLSDVKVIDTDASDHNALVGGFRIEV